MIGLRFGQKSKKSNDTVIYEKEHVNHVRMCACDSFIGYVNRWYMWP